MPARSPSPLTRDAIVSAAVAIADVGGISAITMRAVATSLGVEAMSLYHHLADKRALLEAAAVRVWAGVTYDASGTWQGTVRAIATAAHETLLEHAWVLDVASSAGGVERMRVIEALLRELDRAGLSPEDIYEGYHLIDALILGYTAQVASYRAPTDATAVAASIPAEFTHVQAHAAAHSEPRTASGLRTGIDIVIEALAERAPRG